ncbi:MAG: hypothetical protein WBO10_11450 [Pyrinomonadaceae bacterium]
MKMTMLCLVVLALLMVGASKTSAQPQRISGWDTICIDGIKDREVIECPGLVRGDGYFSLTRFITNNSTSATTTASFPLKFIKTTNDPDPPMFKPDPKVGNEENVRKARLHHEKYRPRELELLDYTPVKTAENQIWSFRGRVGSIGDESGRDAWLATLDFTCHHFVEVPNQPDPNVRKMVVCGNGAYEGKLRVKEIKSGAIYTMNLTVNVDFPPAKE